MCAAFATIASASIREPNTFVCKSHDLSLSAQKAGSVAENTSASIVLHPTHLIRKQSYRGNDDIVCHGKEQGTRP
eukprot:4702440-Pleurochrysis_carterae.AAC.1